MFLLARRSVGQTIVEFILSCIFLGLLLSLRYVFDRNYNAAYQISRFRPQDTMLFNGLTANVTYYYPVNPCTTTIVTNAISELSTRWSSFPTSIQSLSNPNIDALPNATQDTIYAFIYFTNLDSCTSPSTMPDQITYTLRMQEDIQYTYHAQSAKIDENDYLWKRSPEDFCQARSTTANYTGQFLGVQFFIDLSIIQYTTNITQDPSSIHLNHFGCPEYYADDFHSVYAFFIPILISLIFVTSFILNVGYIVEERQNKTKEYLRIFGLRTWINNLVWVTRTMCIYFVLIAIITGLCMIILPSSGVTQNSVSKAMFNYTDWTLLWTILFVYSIELSTFSVFFGQLFKRPLLAKFVAFILWILTFIDFYPGAPLAVRYIMCLFPNTGLMFCLLVVQQYERKNEIATFKQLYSNIFNYPLYIGICLLLMLVYSFIYMLLAVYVERINPGEFGVAQPWYYIFKQICCKQQRRRSITPYVSPQNLDKTNDTANTTSYWIEVNPLVNGIDPSISTINLIKKFGQFQAVSNLSLHFYKGEVCSLLGHNGAGKTTVTFILVGMMEPTSGCVVVEGFDYRTHSQEIRKMIGFCPQYDILYDQLSVEEHLKLMAQMRHMNEETMDTSINTILDLIGLMNDRCTLSKDLSGGMKRRLSIGIALVGDPQVLILDEPTSGIDPPNRRLIWTIIRKMKEAGKCVVLTTHFLEEADILSDRIAIMANGRLQATGTPNFLKQQAEFEYRLFIEKKEICNTENITRFIQEYVHDVVLERETSSELVFGIKRGASQHIGRLINALDEQQQQDIAINSYGLSMTTIEEVFLRLVQEEEEKIDNYNHCTAETRRTLAKRIFSHHHEHITGFRLFWIRIWSLLVKRWILSRRQILFLLGFFLLPIFLEIIAVAILPTPNDIEASILQNRRYPDAQIQLIPSIYNPHTAVTYSNNNGYNAQSRLRDYLTNTNANIEELSSNTLIDYVLSQWNQSEDYFINKYQLGIALFNNITSSSPSLTFDAFFSTVNYHAMPTSLGIAATNLFQFYGNSSSKMIVTTNQPILISTGLLTGQAFFFQLIFCFDTIPVSLFNFINGIIASIFISILSLNIIRERISHAKNLQLLTGLSKFTYWFSHALYDFVLCLFLCSLLTIVVKIGAAARSDPNAEVRIYNSAEQTGYFFFIFLLYSLGSLPFIYAYSLIPITESVGLILYVIVNILVCFIDMVLGFIVVFFQGQTISRTNTMTNESVIMTNIRLLLSILFPTVNLKHALFNIHLRSSDTCVSAVNSILGTNYSSSEPWLSMQEPGLGVPFVVFVSQMIGWWLIIMFIEQCNRICQRRSRCCRKTNLPTTAIDWNDSELDEDVRNERRMILSKSEASTSAVVVIEDLVHTFKKRKENSLFRRQYTAVDHLSFYAQQGSCFGLLGTNGAGKTTTFRMLIDDIKPTSGAISIKKMKHSEIGFCPQFDWLVDHLNVTETITLFARLKGIPSAAIPSTCTDMIQLFGLDTYEKREVQKLSGGNKRKVSAALAFIANPTLIFLDEPTTGLDAAAKRKLWNVIRAAREVGLTIIMTSHSMEECEALCTKIGIMKLGQFVCLGNLQRLKNRFSHGYAVQVKVPSNTMDTFKDELILHLPGIEIEVQHNGMLYCTVPISSSTNSQHSAARTHNLAHVFEFFNNKKEQNEIESYSLTQTTLEQIFIRLAGQDEQTTLVTVF